MIENGTAYQGASLRAGSKKTSTSEVTAGHAKCVALIGDTRVSPSTATTKALPNHAAHLVELDVWPVCLSSWMSGQSVALVDSVELRDANGFGGLNKIWKSLDCGNSALPTVEEAQVAVTDELRPTEDG